MGAEVGKTCPGSARETASRSGLHQRGFLLVSFPNTAASFELEALAHNRPPARRELPARAAWIDMPGRRNAKHNPPSLAEPRPFEGIVKSGRFGAVPRGKRANTGFAAPLTPSGTTCCIAARHETHVFGWAKPPY